MIAQSLGWCTTFTYAGAVCRELALPYCFEYRNVPGIFPPKNFMFRLFFFSPQPPDSPTFDQFLTYFNASGVQGPLGGLLRLKVRIHFSHPESDGTLQTLGVGVKSGS